MGRTSMRSSQRLSLTSLRTRVTGTGNDVPPDEVDRLAAVRAKDSFVIFRSLWSEVEFYRRLLAGFQVDQTIRRAAAGVDAAVVDGGHSFLLGKRRQALRVRWIERVRLHVDPDDPRSVGERPC